MLTVMKVQLNNEPSISIMVSVLRHFFDYPHCTIIKELLCSVLMSESKEQDNNYNKKNPTRARAFTMWLLWFSIKNRKRKWLNHYQRKIVHVSLCSTVGGGSSSLSLLSLKSRAEKSGSVLHSPLRQQRQSHVFYCQVQIQQEWPFWVFFFHQEGWERGSRWVQWKSMDT